MHGENLKLIFRHISKNYYIPEAGCFR